MRRSLIVPGPVKRADSVCHTFSVLVGQHPARISKSRLEEFSGGFQVPGCQGGLAESLKKATP